MGLSISKCICHFYFEFKVIPVPIGETVFSVFYSPHLSPCIDIIGAVNPESARTLSFFASSHIQVFIIPAELLDLSIALNSCGKISLSFCIIQSVLMHIIIVLGILLSALHFSIHNTTSSITYPFLNTCSTAIPCSSAIMIIIMTTIYTLRSGSPPNFLHKQRTQYKL